MNKNAVKNIIHALGSSEIQAALGVSGHSVRQAKFKGAFPASWYDAVLRLCEGRGQPCPRDAFSFRTATRPEKDRAVCPAKHASSP